MTLQGKVAVVTGAARGLGRAYALRLARLGADVAVLDINLDGAAAFGEQLQAASVADEIRGLGRRAIGIQVDLARRAEATAAIERVKAELGRLDVLVNNAGGATTPFERSRASQAPDEDFQAMLDSNLMSAIHCCQAAVPIMRGQGSGSIINIATVAALSVVGRGNLAPYALAKAAVANYTRYLAAEVGPDGIRVNAIAPGIIVTARIAAQAAERGIGTGKETKRIPLRRMGTPEDCAGVVEFLATELSGYVTGQCISVCGGVVLTPS